MARAAADLVQTTRMTKMVARSSPAWCRPCGLNEEEDGAGEIVAASALLALGSSFSNPLPCFLDFE